MGNATNRWLDRLAAADRAKGGTGTDYKLAQIVGVDPQLMSKYRRGVAQMGDGPAIALAEALGEQPLRVIGEIQADTARDVRSKKFWTDTARRAAGKIAAFGAVMMTAFALWAFPSPSTAGVSVAADSTIYTMRSKRRRDGRPRWWRWLFWSPIPDIHDTGAALA